MKGYLLLIFPLFFINSSHSNQHSNNLTVKATGVIGREGLIEFGLYNGNENFAEVGKTFKSKRVVVSGSEVKCTFENLQEGKYGVCIYHDKNSNKICDRNFFGIPLEAYGFSNNIKPKFAAPRFEDCAINLKNDRAIVISLIN